MRLIERIFDKLRWPDPKPSEGIVIEDQIGVLKAIAKEPGSIIKDEEPYRAGKPLRYRTVQRLLELGQLTNGQDDRSIAYSHIVRDVGLPYITLTARGWERITVKLDL